MSSDAGRGGNFDRVLAPWHGFWRSRAGAAAWTVGVAVVGAALVLGGLAMLVLPGPGWLVVFAGLAVLGLEFAWARGVLTFAKKKVSVWTEWVSRQNVWVRVGIGAGCLALVAAAMLGAVWIFGVPGWVPEPVASAVDAVLPQ